MSSQTNTQASKNSQPINVDFHGAAVIDAEGREMPITESMIQEACAKLDSHWQFPASGRRQVG